MTNLDPIVRALRAQLPELEILEYEPMRAHCSFRIGGPARALVRPASAEETAAVCRIVREGGAQPLIIGNGTALIGDPSGKSAERNLLDEATLRHNQEAIKKQLARFIDFDSDAPNAAELVNNYDWMKEFTFLDFIRDIGKCITVNYMMAKDSVKKRFSGEGDGMSFTEFTYQLVQGYDFLHLYQTMNCKVQLGGADQWGNITTGTELIRRKLGSEAEAFAITCPLITKADGTKFGKTESGNVWLDPRYTSPYKFYQFWLNVSDEDAKRYIRIFTLLDRETVEALTAEHETAPHLRILQKRLAQEITTMIHSKEEYEKAVEASAILFGGSTSEALRKLDEETLLQVFEGVPQFRIARAELGLPFVDLCVEGRVPQDGAGRRRVAQQGEGHRRGARGDRSGPDRRQVPAGAEGQEELLPPDRRIRWSTASFSRGWSSGRCTAATNWNARSATVSRSIWN